MGLLIEIGKVDDFLKIVEIFKQDGSVEWKEIKLEGFSKFNLANRILVLITHLYVDDAITNLYVLHKYPDKSMFRPNKFKIISKKLEKTGFFNRYEYLKSNKKIEDVSLQRTKTMLFASIEELNRVRTIFAHHLETLMGINENSLHHFMKFDYVKQLGEDILEALKEQSKGIDPRIF